MKNIKIVLRDTGVVLIAVGVVTLFVTLISLLHEEYDEIIWIVVTSAVFFLVGGLFRFIGRCTDEPRIRHAMMTAAVSWLIISLISTIPFHFITNLDFLSALFESVAGWTGTGLTMFSGSGPNVILPHDLSYTIQFWRTFIQWVGGVGVIVLTLVVLARPGTGSFTLYRSEAREEKIHPNIISTVKTIWWIFLLYTGIAIALLVIFGMPIWEAINHAMTGLATGGFSVTDDSITSYSLPLQIAIIPLMIAGAIAFSAHYDLLNGRVKKFFKDVQTQALLLLVISTSIILAYINYNGGTYDNFLQSFKYSGFQFASALTCTGFATTDISGWLGEAKLILAIAMIAGGAAGSTAGGIKLFRVILLTKGIGWKIRSIFLPTKGTLRHRLGDKVLSEADATEEINEAAIVSFLWVILLVVGVLVTLHVTHATVEDTFFEVCSAQGNVGLSVGITGIDMEPIAKFMLILNMWVGRLEIIPILVLIRGILKGGRIF